METLTFSQTISDLERSADAVPLEQSVEKTTTTTEWKPPETLFDTLWALCSWYTDRPFLGTRKRNEDGSLGDYTWKSYSTVWQEASCLGSGLLHLGLMKPKEFFGICSPNRPEWIVGDFTTVQYRFVSVPLVVTLDDETLAFVLNQAEVKCVLASQDNLDKFLRVVEQCPHLRGVVVMDSDAELPAHDKIKLYKLKEVLEIGANNWVGEYPGKEREPNELWSVIYTSGSTGMPKGAMMSDKRWNHFCTKGYLMPEPCRIISFAPLGHVSERQLFWLVAFYGGMYGFYNGDMAGIFEDMQVLNPTYLSCPPRIYNSVYTQYKEVVEELVKKRGESERWKIELESLDQFKGVFGNAIQFLVTGSAPTSDVVMQFLRRCFAVPLYDGYGTTEAGGIATDGTISAGVDVKLIDVPELGYFTTDNPPRGEICVKTEVMIDGYFKNEEKTKESFVDGYFRTGDIGVRKLPYLIEIIDRIKNVFKLAQGEFVAPSKIESVLEKSALLDQICCVGAPQGSPDQVVAIVVCSVEVCARLFPENSGTLESLVENHGEKLELVFLSDFTKLAKSGNLLSYEVPRRVILSKFPFTAENNLLTPSMKLKRAQLEKKFSNEIQYVVDHPLKNDVMDDKLRQVVNDVVGQNTTLQLDNSFALQGGDSLSAVRIVSKIKEQFGKDVPLSFVLNNPSLKELAQLVSDESVQTKIPSLPKLAVEDLSSDVKHHLGPERQKCESLSNCKTVFLTGATGFLGAFLLRDLLDRFPEMTVVCLVRGDKDRLANSFAKRKIKVDWSRVEIQSGNLENGLLGCPDLKSFNSLARRIDAVFHSAAHVNWMLAYEKLRNTNVLPCHDLIRFCSTQKTKHLFHISTISCCPVRRQQEKLSYETYEGIATEDYATMLGPYAQSKYVAEQMLLKCVPELSLSIFRPSNICPDSVSGSSNLTDYIHRYVHSAIELGLAMHEGAKINFTPVDYCTEAIISCALGEKKADGTIFNISNNNSPTYYDIAIALDAVGFKVQQVSYTDFRKALFAFENKEQLQLYGLLPMFTEKAWIYNSTEASDCSNTNKYTHKECPKTDVGYLKTWLLYLIDIEFLKKNY